MDLQKLCETYEIIHAKLSSELEKGGYDRAVVDELSAGITGKAEIQPFALPVAWKHLWH